METDKEGTIFLPTKSAIAVWKNEIVGQLSDGAWENTTPYDHWKFWAYLDVELGEPKVISKKYAKKKGYALSSLIKYVGDRMIKIGKLGLFTEEGNGEYMPDTFEEWKTSKETGKWKWDFLSSHMEPITEEIAKQYYESSYNLNDLRKDLKVIKEAMKTAPSF